MDVYCIIHEEMGTNETKIFCGNYKDHLGVIVPQFKASGKPKVWLRESACRAAYETIMQNPGTNVGYVTNNGQLRIKQLNVHSGADLYH